MSRLSAPGSDDNIWSDTLNDFLSIERSSDMGSAATPASAYTQSISGASSTLLTRILHRRWLKLVAALFCLLVVIASSVLPAHASLYGRGQYGMCIYQDCAPVVVTTPGGLEVAINLHDNQVIPREGYTITITPLNGSGSSFKEARIYIEDVLVATITPGSDGTARWEWDPTVHPGTHIRIDIVDTDDTVTSHAFTVTIGAATQGDAPPGSSGVSPPAPDNTSTNPIDSLISFIGGAVQQTYQGLEQVVRDLPPPVAEGFPYFLFLLLGLNLLILFLHFQRELRELRAYQAILARARLLAEQKQVFISLISHYLRTPVTVLAGGVDLLTTSNIGRSLVHTLHPIVERIRTKIDALLLQTKSLDTHTAIDRQLARVSSFWRQLNLFLPLALIGLILVLYNALALTAGKFSYAEIQILAQLIIFSALVLTTYQIFRRRYLSAHDNKLTQELIQQEEALAEARDSFMTHAVNNLAADVRDLETTKASLAGVGDSDRIYVTEGIDRLQTIIEQFATAESLRGIRAQQPQTTIPLSELLREVQPLLERDMEERHISLVLLQDTAVHTANRALLVRVLGHVITNAVEYSKDSSQVEVSGNSTTITIRDHGVGIPADKLPLIFQPFYKAEGAQSFNHEGMGFSLYLDKIIMTYLGGDISLSSSPSQGTTVVLHI